MPLPASGLYVEPSDLKEAFSKRDLVQITNRGDRNAQAINEPLLLKVCQRATGIADGWLQRKYAMPLAGVSENFVVALMAYCLDISRYLLDASGERVQENFDEAMEWLKTISDPDQDDATTSAGADEIDTPELGANCYVDPSPIPQTAFGGLDLNLFC